MLKVNNTQYIAILYWLAIYQNFYVKVACEVVNIVKNQFATIVLPLISSKSFEQ